MTIRYNKTPITNVSSGTLQVIELHFACLWYLGKIHSLRYKYRSTWHIEDTSTSLLRSDWILTMIKHCWIDAELSHSHFAALNTRFHRVTGELCHVGIRVKNIHTALIYGEQVTDPSELPHKEPCTSIQCPLFWQSRNSTRQCQHCPTLLGWTKC